MPKHPTNSAVAKGIGTTEPNAASWAAFDGLPRLLRRVLWEAPVSINPLSVAALVEDGDDDYARIALGQAIGEEVLRFNAEHKRDHGYPLPAIAARVSPQRHRDDIPPTKPKAGKREIIRRRKRRRQ